MTKPKRVARKSAKKKAREKSKKRASPLPGISLEMAVARIQQLMDPNSSVTHNERLVDRVGNTRQYDVVIRGTYAGQQMLGVIECKDHNKRKGPDAVDAFAKKTENLGVNLRMMVSRRGFTPQALRSAKHENISCLSIIPHDPKLAGFTIGQYWYGVISRWTNVFLQVTWSEPIPGIVSFASESVKWQGKPVLDWFLKKLMTEHQDRTKEGAIRLELVFREVRNLEIDGKEYPVATVVCNATGEYALKRKWVSWTGDGFYDWNQGRFTLPANSTFVGSAVETDLNAWEDLEGDIPEFDATKPNSFRMMMFITKKWDDATEVPDLDVL